MAQDAAETTEQRKTSTSQDLRALASKTMTVAATVIRMVTLIFAAILIIHVVLTVAGANPANSITQFFAGTASHLTLGMANLFMPPASPSLTVILNYGLAAVVWIVIGIFVSKLLNALAP